MQGYVDEISPSYLNKIFEIKPEMHHIYANKTEDFDTLRAFALTPVIGSVYDLREKSFSKAIRFYQPKQKGDGLEPSPFLLYIHFTFFFALT